MPPKRYSEEQILAVLKEADVGMNTRDILRKHGIGADTFYRWKRKYGGVEQTEMQRLRALEEENGRLKRLVADQAVQIQILKEVNSKKW